MSLKEALILFLIEKKINPIAKQIEVLTAFLDSGMYSPLITMGSGGGKTFILNTIEKFIKERLII